MSLALMLLAFRPAMLILANWKLFIFLFLVINIVVIVYAKYSKNPISTKWNVWQGAIPFKIVTWWCLLFALMLDFVFYTTCFILHLPVRNFFAYALISLIIIPLIIYGKHLALKTEIFWKKYLYLSLSIILAFGLSGTLALFGQRMLWIFLGGLFIIYVFVSYVCICLPADLLAIIEALTNRASLIPPKKEKSIKPAYTPGNTEPGTAQPAPVSTPPVNMGNKFLRIVNARVTAIGFLILFFCMFYHLSEWFFCECFGILTCGTLPFPIYVDIISCIVAVPYIYLIVKEYRKRVDTWLYTIAVLVAITKPSLFMLFFFLGAIATCYHFFRVWISPKPAEKGVSPAVSTPPVKGAHTITPLLGAILANDADLVRTALQEHPEYLNTAYAQNGNTPLHVAAWNGQTEIVKLLLEQPGLDTTLKNNEGKTAADLAQEKNFTEIITLLRN